MTLDVILETGASTGCRAESPYNGGYCRIIIDRNRGTSDAIRGGVSLSSERQPRHIQSARTIFYWGHFSRNFIAIIGNSANKMFIELLDHHSSTPPSVSFSVGARNRPVRDENPRRRKPH